MAGEQPPVLQVQDLRTEFKLRHRSVVAVDGVSFEVRHGECVGLVGESGCGKSTTGLSVMRLLPAAGRITGGSIILNGRDLVPLDSRQMQEVRGNEVAMIYQDPMTALNPTMPIGKQIGEAVKLHSDSTSAQACARALEVLGLVGMPKPAERIDDFPHQLSGGLRQRVIIAMALVARSRTRIVVSGELPSAINPPSGCRFRTRCPLAQDVCAQEEPPLRLFGTGHRAACHFPLRPPVVANTTEPTHAEDSTT